MRKKPEKYVTLYYYKCRLKCDKSYGLMYTRKMDSELGWWHHAMQFHRGKIQLVPPYILKEKKFKAVKD